MLTWIFAFVWVVCFVVCVVLGLSWFGVLIVL